MGVSIAGKNEDVKSEPNVVPLCDVLLVLLIIFMIVTPLVQKGVDVRLPTALHTTSMPENPDVVLAIKKDGTLFVNQEQATLENVQTRLEEAFLTASDKRLYLKVDEELEYGKLVDLIVIMKEAGVEIVGIISERRTEKID